jgi:hypothetical protein
MVQSALDDLKSSDPAWSISLRDIYAQALTTMRATDDISLRLLAAVPFVSGIGITLLVRKPSEQFPATARLLVSLFAAVVTLAIYRWERRNMSHCKHIRNWATEVENAYLHDLRASSDAPLVSAPHGDNLSSRFFSRTWGKTQAEKLLYSTVIAGWLITGIYVVAS